MPYPLTDSQDEDFRSRYPVETAGMPTNLAAVASQNLAAQDASIAKVNAAGRLNPSPGVGALGSTAQTDATNLDVAAAMDRGDAFDRGAPMPSTIGGPAPSLTDAHLADIADRRDQLDQKKKEIMANLGMIPPGEAGFAAVVLPSNDKQGQLRRKEMLQNLAALETQSNDLLHEHHYIATEAARTAHENLARQTHIAASNDFASMSNDLLGLQKDPNVKPGTPEFQARALEIARNHPQGFQTQAGQTLFRGIAQTHDTAANLEDRSYWQRFGQSFKEASQVARKRGVDVQYDDQGFPSTGLTSTVDAPDASPQNEDNDKELFNAYGIRQTNLLNPQSVRVVGQPKSTDPGNAAGNFVEVKTLSKGQPTTVYMPRSDYLRFGGKLAGPEQPATAPNATASTTATQTPVAEVTRVTKDGRQAVFDANTKQFLRYAQ